MDKEKLVEEILNLRKATLEQMDELKTFDVEERERLAGRRDAFDEVLILLGQPIPEGNG
jgi:hypothetical protein